MSEEKSVLRPLHRVILADMIESGKCLSMAVLVSGSHLQRMCLLGGILEQSILPNNVFAEVMVELKELLRMLSATECSPAGESVTQLEKESWLEMQGVLRESREYLTGLIQRLEAREREFRSPATLLRALQFVYGFFPCKNSVRLCEDVLVAVKKIQLDVSLEKALLAKVAEIFVCVGEPLRVNALFEDMLRLIAAQKA